MIREISIVGSAIIEKKRPFPDFRQYFDVLAVATVHQIRSDDDLVQHVPIVVHVFRTIIMVSARRPAGAVPEVRPHGVKEERVRF